MSFALKKDGSSFRAVESADDCASDEVFSIGLPVIQQAPPTRFTSLEFLDRFTNAEQLAVVEATMQSAPVKLWYDRLLAASYVDLADPRTEGGIDALIAAGLIAADRKAALLTLEVTV